MSDTQAGLLLAACWAMVAGAVVAWLRDGDAKVVRKERWPWMYLAYLWEGAKATLLSGLLFPLLFMLAAFYVGMFVLGPGLIYYGIFGSGPTPVGRVALILGGIAVATVFTFVSLLTVKDEWVARRQQDLREKRQAKRNEVM